WLSYDSRTARPGPLFFAVARDPDRNRANIADALNRGVRAVVVRGAEVEAARAAATLVTSGRPRLLLGAAASRFLHAPSERIDLIGGTGASGKKTTPPLLASILLGARRPAP